MRPQNTETLYGVNDVHLKVCFKKHAAHKTRHQKFTLHADDVIFTIYI